MNLFWVVRGKRICGNDFLQMREEKLCCYSEPIFHLSADCHECCRLYLFEAWKPVENEHKELQNRWFFRHSPLVAQLKTMCFSPFQLMLTYVDPLP